MHVRLCAHHLGPLMAPNDPLWSFTFLFVFLCVFVSSNASDSEALIKFKNSLANDDALSNWNASIIPCFGDNKNWIGLLCSNGTIWGLQLENMGLMGIIDVESLMGLPYLRSLSFMNNSFDGPIPDVKKLGALKSVFLSNNNFSGEIPDDAFAGMGSLKKIYLAQNGFTGKIPTSLVKLPKLLELRLDGNQFQGKIPNFQLKELKLMNVSNNQLEGPIPTSLSKMDRSGFLGNKDLCGKPLDLCNSSKKLSVVMIAIIVMVVVVVLAAIITAFFILRNRRPAQLGRATSSNNTNKVVSSEGDQMELGTSPKHSSHSTKAEHGKLVFIRDDMERFDLQDLLRASAEVLGSGNFGSSYKAALLNGSVMVVKRFRHMNNVGKEEFQEHMRRLGRLKHPNLLSLVAFYYRKEEKLLVTDFVGNGSLAYHLHGNRTPEMPALNWPTRLKIIKGVAKGLAYLNNELPSLMVSHGHLKSSNVLLNESFEPLLTDYGLLPITNKDHAIQLMVAFKSPEYTRYSCLRKKTDVWSLGILILEMLTGKFPENYLNQGKGGKNVDLASWVNSVVREEWTGEVFDKEMKEMRNSQGEMLKLLKIGLSCCEEEEEKRWELKEAIERIEEVRERDSDEESSSFASEGDMYSSRAMTEDELSFSINS